MRAVLFRNGRWPALILARWWRHWTRGRSDLAELNSCGRYEVEHIAQDVGVSAFELCSLVSRGPNGANLLERRLAALHLDAAELGRSEPATLRDLQRLCAMCGSRGRCARDLAQDLTRNPVDPTVQDWRDYCPNGATLNMLSTLQICSDPPE